MHWCRECVVCRDSGCRGATCWRDWGLTSDKASICFILRAEKWNASLCDVCLRLFRSRLFYMQIIYARAASFIPLYRLAPEREHQYTGFSGEHGHLCKRRGLQRRRRSGLLFSSRAALITLCVLCCGWVCEARARRWGSRAPLITSTLRWIGSPRPRLSLKCARPPDCLIKDPISLTAECTSESERSFLFLSLSSTGAFKKRPRGLTAYANCPEEN